jgi:F-type H+-transporting ATPase subunit b
MPQFDIGTFPSQIFWLAICFSFLYMMMHFYIVPTIDGILVTRKNRIARDSEQAQIARKEAEAAKQAHKQALEKAHQQAMAMVEGIIIRNKELAAARNAEMEKHIMQHLAVAEREILVKQRLIEESVVPLATRSSHQMLKELVNIMLPVEQIQPVAQELYEVGSK